MHKNKNSSRVKGFSSFRMEVAPNKKNSIENVSPLHQTNRRIHVHSSLLHAQRNIKFITKNQLKKQLFDSQHPTQSLPKLNKELAKNHSTLEKQTNADSYLQDNTTKDAKVFKNLFISAKDSKKKDKQRHLNLLGLEIKRIQPQVHPEYRNIETANYTNIIGYKHSSFILPNNQTDAETGLILQPEGQNQDKFLLSCTRTKSSPIQKKKTMSLPTGPKYQYYHNKVPKFNFAIGSESYKIYEKRMKIYREFIFTIQMAHNVHIQNQIKTCQSQISGLYLKNQSKYKVWIGPGNNWMLIKSLIKRRYWWMIVQQRNLNDVNFVWTQIKVNSIFQKQKPSLIQEEAAELRKSADDEESDYDKKKRPQSIVKKHDKKQSDNLNFDLMHKILNPEDKQIVKKYLQKHLARQKKSMAPMQYRHKNIKKQTIKIQDNRQFLVHNHLQNNFFLGNKKAMFYNLKQYYELTHDNVFNYLPLTFHIRNGTNDIQYKRFQMYYKKRAAYIIKQEKEEEQRRKKEENSDEEQEERQKKKKLRNIWIVKPGELSNRGNGITVIDELYEINNMLNKKEKHQNGTNKTYIVQLYIDRPLLYNNRKFDIRHYMLVTNMFGVMRGYWYQEGYIRTASYQFDIFTFDKEIHLTNDAVQKHTPHYGKYQQGNKLSYAEFQRYLDSKYPKKSYNFEAQIIPKMKKFATDAVKSAYLKLSPDHRQNNFQIFGLDFMIDNQFKPWLIEINTNPCLELSSPLLERIIPVMVENSFRLSLDVMFPPPSHYPNTSKHLVPDLCLQNHKYQLIFDSISEGAEVQRLYRDVRIQKLMDEIGAISDEEDEYDDNGEEISIDDI